MGPRVLGSALERVSGWYQGQSYGHGWVEDLRVACIQSRGAPEPAETKSHDCGILALD